MQLQQALHCRALASLNPCWHACGPACSFCRLTDQHPTAPDSPAAHCKSLFCSTRASPAHSPQAGEGRGSSPRCDCCELGASHSASLPSTAPPCRRPRHLTEGPLLHCTPFNWTALHCTALHRLHALQLARLPIVDLLLQPEPAALFVGAEAACFLSASARHLPTTHILQLPAAARDPCPPPAAKQKRRAEPPDGLSP